VKVKGKFILEWRPWPGFGLYRIEAASFIIGATFVG
jgi:hypothetical protein